MCVCVCVCVCVYTVLPAGAMGGRRWDWTPGTRGTDSCKLPDRGDGNQREQPGPLTTEPSLYPLKGKLQRDPVGPELKAEREGPWEYSVLLLGAIC